MELPSEPQVKLLLDLFQAFPDPHKMPAFMKKRRAPKQNRPLASADFIRPVETAEEHTMFITLLPVHSKKHMKGADLLGFCRDLNIRVTRIWSESKSISNLCFKTAQHLSEYGNKLLLQASQAEVNQTTSAVSGLPATASAFTSLRPPSSNQGPPRRGTGVGGAGGTKKCPACSNAFAREVPRRGHDCVLYTISIGRDPTQFVHTQTAASKLPQLPTAEEAQSQLDSKLNKSVNSTEGKSKRMKYN